MLIKNVYYAEQPKKVYIYPYPDGGCRIDFPVNIMEEKMEEGIQYLTDVYSMKSDLVTEETVLDDYDKWLERAKDYIEPKRRMVKSMRSAVVDNASCEPDVFCWQSGYHPVYGGIIDFANGKLTITHRQIDMGDIFWEYLDGYFKTYDVGDIKRPATAADVPDVISSAYLATNFSDTSDMKIRVVPESDLIDDRYLQVKNTNFTDASAFTNAMQGVSVVYELALPDIHSINANQIIACLGENNVWSDANGGVRIRFLKSLPDSGSVQYSVEGTYLILYEAEDACGNRAEVIRPIIVYDEAYTKYTILFSDGTMVINAHVADLADYMAIHGNAFHIYPPLDENHDYNFSLQGYAANTYWWYEKDEITHVEFGEYIQPTSMAYWFYACWSLTSIDFTNLDTSQCTSMNSTFSGCIALVSLDLSSFDTRNVTNMYNMFGSCTSLQNLNVSNFDTSQVTNMQWMFEGCKQLAALHLSNFDTSSVTNMGGMFGFCEQLIALDLSNFDTSSATSMDGMFDNCISLQDLDVSSFDTSNVLYMNKMFYECESLEELYLPLFDSSSVTDVMSIFSHCSALTTIYTTSAFDLSGVSLSYSAFYNCTSLIGGNGTVYNSAHMDGAYGRIDASGTPGYFTAIS